MKKLLVICGPTATGKTSLALTLANKFNGELISADSRQVYNQMDIGTGKDLPKNSRFNFQSKKIGGYYLIKGIKVWGYDLVEVSDDFSVAKYIKFAKKIIVEIRRRRKLSILVGGTGLYIKGVVDGISTAAIPKNVKLRSQLGIKTVKELFGILAHLDPSKAASLNLSDKKNPRRLVRAIEIAGFKNIVKKNSFTKHDVLLIGLKLNQEDLGKRIKQRVQKRLSDGFEKEIGRLIKKGLSEDSHFLSSLGYRQWMEFINGKLTYDEALRKWINEERKYAKRQMVWFKKDKRIKWFDISDNKYQKNVEKLVKKWYNRVEERES